MPSGRIFALSAPTAFIAGLTNGLDNALTKLIFTAAVIVALPAGAQSVISTRAGVIHFFEGNVYLGDQPLEARLGKYVTIPQGAELRTADGRAEVLLTPGVFLRMGAQTTIRLTANGLADTRVELLKGSVIVDSGEPNPNTSVTVTYKEWSVHLLQQGLYRIDGSTPGGDPPGLTVRQGQAEVSTSAGGKPLTVEQGMNLPFAGVLVADRASEPTKDALNDWSNGRNDSITADNAITAQLDQDPSAQAADPYGFTYFPMLGVPAIGLSSVGGSLVPYSSYPATPGFYSVYLPGYTYRPMILGLMGVGVGPIGRPGVYLPSYPRYGSIPGSGITIRPLPRPMPVRVPVGPRGAVGAHVGGAHR